MPTQIAVSFSSLHDPADAFKAAAIDVKNQLNAVRVDLVIIFATPSYMNPQGLEALHRILQPARLIGSITSGLITGTRIESRGVAILAAISSKLRFGTAKLDGFSSLEPLDAGYKLAHALMQDYKSPQRNALLFFYSGLRANGSPLCTGLRENLGTALPLVGAIGANSLDAASSSYFFQSQIIQNAAAGLLIGGAQVAGACARHSWQPLGKPRLITAADGNIIKSIDHMPASSLYVNYFEDDGASSKSEQFKNIRLLYPLGISTGKRKEYLIRTPIDILDDGSIVCQGDVPMGSTVHLMITDKDVCRHSLREAAFELREQLSGKSPEFVLIFDSVMRHKILGRNATEGLYAVREALGPSVPILGMHTFGEVAPYGPENNVMPQMLNGSLALLAIG